MSSFGDIDNKSFEKFAQNVDSFVSSHYLKKEMTKTVKHIGVQYQHSAKDLTPSDDIKHGWYLSAPTVTSSLIEVELYNNNSKASMMENGERLQNSWFFGSHMLQKSTQQISAQIPQLITPVFTGSLMELVK